eukprot:TCONS_00021623-protein
MEQEINNVGIKYIELYFPSQYVSQKKLEKYDQVSPGKYTIGLGQQKMGFCGDQEDIHSLSLTVLKNLLEKNKINPKDVGRLEVGTETLIDKSKSVKTVLMQLFEESGNSDIEGLDTTNACFGGTGALFNAINWIESSSYDGRLAIVIIADIAVYAEGNARCTGGAGAVALAIAPNAPLVFDTKLRALHMAHQYDFYKPDMHSEYPTINGQLSLKCYLSAVDTCYQLYGQKFNKKFGFSEAFTMKNLDYMVFHTPYCKIVQKSVGRCILNDFIHSSSEDSCFENLTKYRGVSLEDTYENASLFKEIERACVEASKDVFNEKTMPSLQIATNVGNMYSPSLYSSLCSLLCNKSMDDLLEKRIAFFSYGSGLASAMFSLKVTDKRDELEPLIRVVMDCYKHLDQRREIEPQDFVKTLELREKRYNAKSYSPESPVADLFPGTYYLSNVDDKFRRTYERKT